MSQTYTADTYAATNVFSTDLGNIEENFETLRSNFSGTTGPSSPACQFWFDMTNKALKVRNTADSAWLGVMYGATSFKVWIYANSTEDGWTQDSSITDKVVAIKGGDTYTTGGITAGSWFITGVSLSSTGSNHNHWLYDHALYSWASNGTTQLYFPDNWVGNVGNRKTVAHTGDGSLYTLTGDLYCEKTTHEHNVSHTGAWRPAAAVGILARPSI